MVQHPKKRVASYVIFQKGDQHSSDFLVHDRNERHSTVRFNQIRTLKLWNGTQRD